MTWLRLCTQVNENRDAARRATEHWKAEAARHEAAAAAAQAPQKLVCAANFHDPPLGSTKLLFFLNQSC